MTHKFLTFPSDWINEAAFRSTYQALTGEAVEAAPQQNADGSLKMIGTARLDAAHIERLLTDPDFAPSLYIGDTPPPGWAPAADPPQG